MNLQDSSKKGRFCGSRSRILQDSRSSVCGTDVIGDASALATHIDQESPISGWYSRGLPAPAVPGQTVPVS